jgi:hypothetical protein
VRYVARGALQSIRYRCSLQCVTADRNVLFWNCASFRDLFPETYHPYRLGDPTVPLAISSALWFFVSRPRRLLFKVTDATLSSSFTFL